jgi:pyruvate,water dikinase
MDPDAPLTLPFEAIAAGDLARVGGKGANLGELGRAGFPVPPGFCVTTDAYRLFFDAACAAGGDPLAALAGVDGADVEAVRAAGARVREGLGRVPMPAAVAAAVAAAWEAAGGDLDGAAWAVRSSATAEDLPGASFAGQQDTYLNVRGRAPLLDAVRRCWISLFTDRAILYRARNGFPHEAVLLSVVVQRMVRPDVSGILFTADPITGHRGVCSIDAGFGLGEALVSGLVSADLYRVDKRSGEVLEKRIGDKRIAIRPLPEGGTREEELPPAQRHAPVLDTERIAALVALGRRIEAHYGRPQDVEWCIERGRTFVVQSRPITTLYPATEEPAPEDGGLHVYVCQNHIQGMIDPIPALGRSLIRLLNPFGKDGRRTTRTRFMTAAGGRLYHDLTELMRVPAAARVFPALLSGSDELMGRALAGVIARPEFLRGQTWRGRAATLRGALQLLGPALARAAGIALFARTSAVLAPRVARMEALVRGHRAGLAATRGAERLGRLHQAVARIFDEIEGPWLPAIFASMAALGLLRRLAGDAGRDDVAALMRAMPGNVVTAKDLAVAELADLARAHPAVTEHLRAAQADPRRALETLPDVAGGAVFGEAVERYLAEFGARCPSEIDVSRPRYRDAPAPFLQAILAQLQAPRAGEARRRHEALAGEAEQAVERLANAARGRRGGALRAAAVRRLARVTRDLTSAREHPKHYAMRVFELVREAVLDDGRALCAAGRLDVADDVFHLTIDELGQALRAAPRGGPEDQTAGARGGGDLRALVAARRADHARWRGLFPPRVLTSEGEAVVAAHARCGLPAGALAGTPASAGVAEGPAKVLGDPHGGVVAPGEILVAPFTDPGWTPLFTHAAGLVMEVGGQMTHGSVVAREYGIPAVVCVADATRLIRTGARVRVDGDRGYVELLDEPGAATGGVAGDPSGGAAAAAPPAAEGSGTKRQTSNAIASTEAAAPIVQLAKPTRA